MSSSQRNGDSDGDNERVAALIVRHMLFRNHSQPGTPVRREELVEVVRSQFPNSRGLLPALLPLAARMCRDILGFDLLDAAPSSAASPGSQLSPSVPLTGARVFLLRSRLSPELLRAHVVGDDTADQIALRLAVCAIVEGAGGSVTEDELWGLLRRMGLQRESANHPTFGNVGDAFQQMIKEKYIVAKKGLDSDGADAVCFELGPFAAVAFPGDKLKKYFEDVCEGKEVG